MAKSDKPDPFLAKVLAYIESRKFKALKARELAPGVIAIADSFDEVDIYFDIPRCGFTDPIKWDLPKDGLPGSCTQATAEIGLLQGINHRPMVKTLEAALPFARENLTPAAAWHSEPKDLEV